MEGVFSEARKSDIMRYHAIEFILINILYKYRKMCQLPQARILQIVYNFL